MRKPSVFRIPVEAAWVHRPWVVLWHDSCGFFQSWREAIDHALRIAR